MSTLYWSLGEAARWLKNMWHWPESGTVPPPDVHFCCGRSGNEENIEESWVILVTSHIVLTKTWCTTTWVRSAEWVGLCQRLCLVVRVDLMFVTAGNETDHAHKIWQGYLRETYFRKQCSSLIGGIKEFEILVAEFMSAVSSSTHFSVSDRCRWKQWATNIIAYLFNINNNKNTFLSPYNALAVKIHLSSTILDACCYC